MALGLIGAIAQAIMEGPEADASSSMSIMGLSPKDGTTVLLPEVAFQFWPESVNVEAEIGWAFKDIPGGTHQLAQWTQNGGRTVTFEVVLSRFMKRVDKRTVFDKINDPFEMNAPDTSSPHNNKPMNISVRQMIRYLQAYYQPTYEKGDQGMSLAIPPPIALLCLPGVGLNEDGRDVIWAVMTQCSVTYNLLFPNGEPRLATASLGFKQIVQWPGQGVVWKDRKLFGPYPKEAKISVGEGPANKISSDASKGP